MSELLNVEAKDASKCLKKPEPFYNKYSRGVLGLVTGSNEYPGAAILSASAAAHANIGMVRYAGPLRAQNLVLQTSPEVVASEQLNGKIDAITVGSGIPDADHCNTETSANQRKYIASILAQYAKENNNSKEQSISRKDSLPPICVDAGALDLLPKQVCTKVVLTPHAGELSSLFTRYDLEISAQEILKNPVEYAQKAADLTEATVLVKGATTAVASPSELHSPIYIAKCAPSWLATAGSGDVLAGILGALLAQRESNNNPENNKNSANYAENNTENYAENYAENENYAFIAASAAVIHGISASLASRINSENNYTQLEQDIVESKNVSTLDHPIVASDIINALPYILGILINIK